MIRVNFLLSPDMRGEAVTNLHDALMALLEKGSLRLSGAGGQRPAERVRREQIESNFSETTTKIVAAFHWQAHLPTSGQVDEATASALDGAVQRMGPPPVMATALSGGDCNMGTWNCH